MDFESSWNGANDDQLPETLREWMEQNGPVNMGNDGESLSGDDEWAINYRRDIEEPLEREAQASLAEERSISLARIRYERHAQDKLLSDPDTIGQILYKW